MTTEESALLDESPVVAGDNPGRVFTSTQKKYILFVVSIAGLLPMFVSGTFVPSIPQVSKDLQSTDAAVSLAVSLSVFATAIGSLFWASYSSVYGRRLIYLLGMPIFCIGSLGVAASSSLLPLLLWRVIQAFGCSGGQAIGAGVIGDIFELEERGTAIGVFFGAVLLGPALAPLAGGTAAQYFSWRYIHVILAAWGILQYLLIYFTLPETSHSHQKDRSQPTPHKRARLVWINPLRCLVSLRSPNLFAITLHSSFALLTDYVLLVPIAQTIGVRYHITNQALIGACFLPNGVGNFIGAPIAGRISDITSRQWRQKRQGVWVPEDRLRKTWIGALVLCPLSIAASGLLTTFVDGPIGLALNLLCLFSNGAGVDFVLNPINSYTIDLSQSQSAELMAAG
ncbi:Drug:H+ antiporter-1 family protein, partial [Paxillus involutus ATCC 200175]